ncbi:DUF602-domain-containing protein [Rozella allomycis CSF55]|uniref:DUF602-domain-containing protein n=1 Tax=Rozella allomycis (strain CSF55) TaxID=988480 RepID=A0A4P9YG81_ROZAC|nr:DUF602-domain-containing protein [Rozella allomycis CSF55]
MGCDGGSIPKRCEMIRTKAKEKQENPEPQTTAKWHFCALSKERLNQPIVSCSLGRLYSKESLIKYLLGKETYGDGETVAGHVRSLKDVTELKLTANPLYEKQASNDGYEVIVAQFICPITRKEMNGSSRFLYYRPCGCVVSEKGANELLVEKEKTEKCPVCGVDVSGQVPLNATAEEQKLLLAAIKSKSKRKKRKAEKEDDSVSSLATKKRVDQILPELEEKLKNASKSMHGILASNSKELKPASLFQGTFNRYSAV